MKTFKIHYNIYFFRFLFLTTKFIFMGKKLESIRVFIMIVNICSYLLKLSVLNESLKNF